MTARELPALRWAAPAAALVLGLVMAAMALRPATTSRADIVLPQGVTGTAMIAGAPAPNSAVITVSIAGKQCETHPAEVHPDGDVYHLLIPFGPNCPQQGAMTFYINGEQASDAIPPPSTSRVLTVNLAIGGTPSTPAAPPSVIPSPPATATPPLAGIPTPTSTTAPTQTSTVPAPSNRNVVPAVSRD